MASQKMFSSNACARRCSVPAAQLDHAEVLVLPAFLNLLAVFLQGDDQNISSYFVHVPVTHISQVQIHNRQEQDLKRRVEPSGF